MIPDEIKKSVYIFLAVLIAIMVGLFSTYILGMGNDNPVEQTAEEFVKEVTGIDIDLSPKGEK